MRKFCAVALACAGLALAPAAAAAGDGGTLERYARGTWQSFVAMTDDRTGLPTDLLHGDGTRDIQTSTTNIGAYMWSAVAAERLGLIGRRELLARMDRTVTTIEGMETFEGTGQFYNWYDHRTGEKMTTGQRRRRRAYPILSSVDNAWLAVGLQDRRRAGAAAAVAHARDLRRDGLRLLLPARGQPHPLPLRARHRRRAVLLRHDRLREPDRVLRRRRQGRPAVEGVLRAGGARSRRPATGRFQETRPEGFTRTYEGQSVYEGTYPTATRRLVPSWGGSMFEALMPTLFVPEEEWGAGAAGGVNHPNTVDAQIDHGINVAGYGAWGFSPSADTIGGYGDLRRRRRRHGPERERVQPRPHAGRPRLHGLPRPRPALPDPPRAPTRTASSRRTPRSSACAGGRDEALASLGAARARLRAFTKWGFYDAVNVDTRARTRTRSSRSTRG